MSKVTENYNKKIVAVKKYADKRECNAREAESAGKDWWISRFPVGHERHVQDRVCGCCYRDPATNYCVETDRDPVCSIPDWLN